jgi:hypothetical protein
VPIVTGTNTNSEGERSSVRSNEPRTSPLPSSTSVNNSNTGSVARVIAETVQSVGI